MNIRIAHGFLSFTILILVGVYEICNPGVKILAFGLSLASSFVLAGLLSLFYLTSLVGLKKRFMDLARGGNNLSICVLFTILTIFPIWLMVLLVFFIYANNLGQTWSIALFVGFLIPIMLFRIWFEDSVKNMI